MELHFRAGEKVEAVKVKREGERFVVEVGGKARAVEVRRSAGGVMDLVVDGRQVRAYTAREGERRLVSLGGARAPWVLEKVDPRRRKSRARAGAGEDTLTATMHGQVAAVLVKPGDAVERGQTLVVLEAMKMELRLAAPHAGRVKAVACQPGEVVERGRVLVELEAAAPPPT